VQLDAHHIAEVGLDPVGDEVVELLVDDGDVGQHPGHPLLTTGSAHPLTLASQTVSLQLA
jgi:hypothetical protein